MEFKTPIRIESKKALPLGTDKAVLAGYLYPTTQKGLYLFKGDQDYQETVKLTTAQELIKVGGDDEAKKLLKGIKPIVKEEKKSVEVKPKQKTKKLEADEIVIGDTVTFNDDDQLVEAEVLKINDEGDVLTFEVKTEDETEYEISVEDIIDVFAGE